MADIIETIKQLIRAGASSDEIVQTLKSMGIEEEEARKLILLAERDMLRVLRNEIRSIAADEFVEQAKKMKGEILAEIREALDAEVRLSRKRMLDLLRDEINKYMAELRHLSDRVDMIERRLYDLEERVSKIPAQRKTTYAKWAAYVSTIVGIGLVGLAALGDVGVWKMHVMIFGILLVVGGAFLGSRSV